MAKLILRSKATVNKCELKVAKLQVNTRPFLKIENTSFTGVGVNEQ